jgi:ketosteroid isomerase-like protein
MSEKNMEVAKRAMDAFNYSNFVLSGVPPFASLREFCDPDVEWDFSRRVIDGEIYHGYEGWVRVADWVYEAFEEFCFSAGEIIDAGESVVVFSHNTGVTKSGIRLDARVVQVLTFRNGKVIAYRYFGEDRAAGLEAVGLTGPTLASCQQDPF